MTTALSIASLVFASVSLIAAMLVQWALRIEREALDMGIREGERRAGQKA